MCNWNPGGRVTPETKLSHAPTSSPQRPAIAGGKSFGVAARAYTMVAALIVVWLAFEYTTNGVFLNPRNFINCGTI